MQRILILDLNYQLNRSIHVPALESLTDQYGRKTGGVFGLLNTIQVCLNRCECSKVIGVWDGGRSKRRLTIYPQQPNATPPTGYKVKRGILPGMTQEEIDEKKQTAERITTGKELANPLLMAAGCHVIEWPEREADDVIAVLARKLAGSHCDQVVIGSDDWDYAQCCDERICVYRPMADQWLSLYNFMPVMGVPIDWACLKKAAEGDEGDSIPGVPDVGPDTVSKAVRSYVVSRTPDFVSEHYDQHHYRNTCPADMTTFFEFCKQAKGKRIQKIAAGREIIVRNLDLIDLRREVFPTDHVDYLMQQVLQSRRFDEMAVVRGLGELNIQSLLAHFAHWSEPFRRVS